MSPASEAVKFHVKRIFFVFVYVLFTFFFLTPKKKWERTPREWCSLDIMLRSAFGLIFLVWSKAHSPWAAVPLTACLAMKEKK